MRFERWIYTLPLRLRSLFRRNNVERELNEELQYHLEHQIQQNIAKGMPAEEARYAALRAFGGVEQLKEETRDTRRLKLIDDLWQDLLYGLRVLRGNRTFTAVAVLTLALGIGANTAIFTLVNTVLLKPLPYETPDRLVRLWARNQKQGTRIPISPAEFLDLQERNQVFDELAALFPAGGGNLTGAGEPERMNGARVSAGIFPVLGVSAILGRTFTPQEDRPGAERTVIISYSLWQRRFNGDKDIAGKTVVLSGIGYTIVGVLPEAFATPGILPVERDVWVPFGLDPALSRPNTRYLRIYGKLKPGVDLQQAQAEMDGLARRRAAAYPETNTDVGIDVVPLHEEMAGQARPALLTLIGAAVFLLLIACSNVANLLLGRAVERRREVAVRLAVGAGRARLLRQLLTEVSLLFLMGGGLGFLLAYWSNDLLVTLVAGMLPRAREIGIDLAVFLFAFGVSLATALLFGLAPALETSNLKLTQVMKPAADSGFRNRGRYGLRSWLVVSQLALSLLLLIGAGLLIETFVRLRQVDLGFNPDRVLYTRISLPAARYPAGRGMLNFNQQLIERVENLPGVQSAAVLDWMPFGDTGGATNGFAFEGTKGSAEFRVTSPGYFRTMEIPLKKGRNFSSFDTAASPHVFIITEAAARRYWPGADPIGARITVQAEAEITGEIVGIVGDARHYTLYEEPAPLIYAPHSQAPWMNRETRELLVRTDGDPLALSDGVRRQIWALEKDVPITGFQSMDAVVSTALAQPSFYALLVGLFAGLALLLAAVGIYGVVSYWVRQRSREIAIRMAIGARQSDAMRLMLRQAGVLVVIGVAGGLAAAFALTRFLSRLQFFTVSPTDPVIFISVPVFLVLIALLACYLPARHATRVDPMAVLRHD
jgi:putative ABC transport system permease protein